MYLDNLNNRPSTEEVGENPIAQAARKALNVRLSRRGSLRVAAGSTLGAILAAAGAPALPVAAKPLEQSTEELPPHGEPVLKISEAPVNTDFIPRTSTGESWSLAVTLNIPDFPATTARETDKLHELTLAGTTELGLNIRLNTGKQDKIHGSGDMTVIHLDDLPTDSRIIAYDTHNERPQVIENGQESWAVFGVSDKAEDFITNLRVVNKNGITKPVKVSFKPWSENDVKNPKFPVVKDITNAFPAQPSPAAEAPKAVQAAPVAQAPARVEGPREPIELPRLKFEQAQPGPDYFFAQDANGNDFNSSAVFRIPFEGMKVRSSKKGIGIVEFLTDQYSEGIALEAVTDPTSIHYNAMSNGKVVPGNVPALYVRTQEGARVSLVDPDGSGRELLAAVAKETKEVVILLPTSYAADIRVRGSIANKTVSTLHELAMGPLTPEWRAKTVVIDANQVADRIQTQFIYR